MARKNGKTQAAVETHARAANDAPRPIATLGNGPSLTTARVDAIDGDLVHLTIRGRAFVAQRDETLHPAVLRGAQQRGERVLVERGDAGEWLVIGALRTQPTPGIDVADAFTIEAATVTLKARTEITLAAEKASVVVRAEGEIDSQAPRILSRAEGLHKITGRTLKLN